MNWKLKMNCPTPIRWQSPERIIQIMPPCMARLRAFFYPVKHFSFRFAVVSLLFLFLRASWFFALSSAPMRHMTNFCKATCSMAFEWVGWIWWRTRKAPLAFREAFSPLSRFLVDHAAGRIFFITPSHFKRPQRERGGWQRSCTTSVQWRSPLPSVLHNCARCRWCVRATSRSQHMPALLAPLPLSWRPSQPHRPVPPSLHSQVHQVCPTTITNHHLGIIRLYLTSEWY